MALEVGGPQIIYDGIGMSQTEARRRKTARANPPSEVFTGAQVWNPEIGGYNRIGSTQQVETPYGVATVDPTYMLGRGMGGSRASSMTEASNYRREPAGARGGGSISQAVADYGQMGIAEPGAISAPAAPTFQMPTAPTRMDRSAANAAAFSRAKDTVGKTGRASLDALRDYFAGRNMSGSGAEMSAIGRSIEGSAGRLDDFTREQTLADLSREQQVEDRDYAGNLTGAQTAYSGALRSRDQDIDVQQANVANRIAAANARRQSILELARLRGAGALY